MPITRTPRCLSARAASNGYDDPILVSVFDGEFAALRDAETVDVNGRTFQTVQIGAWQALATNSSPTVIVEGAVALTELADVAAACGVVGARSRLLTRALDR